MRFLIVSRLSIPDKDRTLPCWEYLRSLGHEVVVEHPDDVPGAKPPDVVISMGVTITDETFKAIAKWPNAPLYCYNWDVYEWVWTRPRPREYDYRKYGDLLRLAKEVWVPSECTGHRTSQWYGLHNWYTILSACPYWDHPNVRDDGYALMCLREIPDPHWGLFERACEAEKIPYRCTRHEVSREEYENAVAGCRFICAPLYELSTGGLSLMEAYYLGKPVLISNSPWNGGADYFHGRAQYFLSGNEADLRHALRLMYERTPTVPTDHKEYIVQNFSDRRMVDDMLRRIKAHGQLR